jgi:hypothetical protein
MVRGRAEHTLGECSVKGRLGASRVGRVGVREVSTSHTPARLVVLRPSRQLQLQIIASCLPTLIEVPDAKVRSARTVTALTYIHQLTPSLPSSL